jgi:hypothetical protein
MGSLKDWALDLYGAFGVKHPTVSLLAALLCGALVFAIGWKTLAHAYGEREAQRVAASQKAEPSSSGNHNQTAGENSGSMTQINK